MHGVQNDVNAARLDAVAPTACTSSDLPTSHYSLAGISCVEITSASNQIGLKEQASRSTDTASSTTVHNQNVDSERRLLFMDYQCFYKSTLYPRKRTARSTATQWVVPNMVSKLRSHSETLQYPSHLIPFTSINHQT